MPQFESEGWQAAEKLGKAEVPDQRLWGRRILSSRKGLTVCFFRSSSYWMRPTYIMDGNLLPYSNDSNVNLIQNTFTEILRIMLSQMSGHTVAQLNWHMKLIITTTMIDFEYWNSFTFSGYTLFGHGFHCLIFLLKVFAEGFCWRS